MSNSVIFSSIKNYINILTFIQNHKNIIWTVAWNAAKVRVCVVCTYREKFQRIQFEFSQISRIKLAIDRAVSSVIETNLRTIFLIFPSKYLKSFLFISFILKYLPNDYSMDSLIHMWSGVNSNWIKSAICLNFLNQFWGKMGM